jgi:hypothetical protein
MSTHRSKRITTPAAQRVSGRHENQGSGTTAAAQITKEGTTT